MTDFIPESSSFPPSTMVGQMVWGSDSDGTFEPPPPKMPAQRSAAALAAATHQLLAALVAKRVPRVEALRRKLEQGRPAALREIGQAAQALQARTEALDFLAARGSDKAPEFALQGEAVIAATQHLAGAARALVERHAIEGPVARLLWIELVLETDSLRKRVRQGAHWLAQMNRDLGQRRAAATAEVSQRALDELGRRGTALHQRLHVVHRLCGHARSIHTLCEQIAEQRGALCRSLDERVAPAAGLLEAALQPLLEAIRYRPLVPEELMTAVEAQHHMQVCLAQLGAHVARLQAGDQELTRELQEMAEKAASLA